MPGPDLPDLLRFRIASGRARLADLKHLLAFVPEQRTADLRVRIDKQDGDVVARTSGEDGWRELDEAATDTSRLIDEVLALVMTGLLREEGVDAGVFDTAERLLAHLVKTADVPGIALGHTQELESIDPSRGTVALRFPGGRVWDLPILCHEFGHHAIAHLKHIEPELGDLRPLRKLLPDKGSGRDRSHIEELVADAIATTCAGPTYPIACLCLRVPDARGAARATDSHPSWCTRVALMREVLDALSVQTRKPRYRSIRETMIDPIVQALLGKVPAAGQREIELAERTVTTIAKHRPELIYTDGDVAITVAERLVDGAAPPAGATPLAVLDGAWRWRLDHLDDNPDNVAGLVVRYCARASGGTP